MSPAQHKSLDELYSDLTSQIEELQAARDAPDEDASQERTYAGHAIDGLADARFYVGHFIRLTRGFQPDAHAA